jgi:acyl carrier protein
MISALPRRFELFSITRDEIQSRIWSVVAEVLAIDTSNMSIDVSIPNDLAPDSLDQVRLYMTLEDEFGRTIPEQDLERIETIRDIVDYVEKAYFIKQ